MPHSNTTIDFVSPRHNFAPDYQDEKDGHIYMPTALLTAMAQVISAGIDVNFYDENIEPYDGQAQKVGISILGHPYIPEAISLQKKIRQKTADLLSGAVDFGLGGQPPQYLSPAQFTELFGRDAHPASTVKQLADWLNINEKDLPAPEKTSLIPAYERLSDEVMIKYLSREFSFYLSQGCKYGCHFCSAIKQTKEVYRSPDVIEKDLKYLVAKVEDFVKRGLLKDRKLSLYLSNLDVFQTPEKLDQFADIVLKVCQENIVDGQTFKINLRGLSTVKEFNDCVDKYPETVKKLVSAGYKTNGFGIDGMTPAVWKKIGKKHNFSASEDHDWQNWVASHNDQDQEQIKAGQLCRDAVFNAHLFGITPELLMVFGHNNADTEESLKLAVEFAKDMVQQYGALIRPHISKDILPGNLAWQAPENEAVVNTLIKHPELFHNLDFTCQANPLTHPDPAFCDLVNRYYDQLCQLQQTTTLPVVPIEANYKPQEVRYEKVINGQRQEFTKIINIVDSISKTAVADMKAKNRRQYDH